jgi:uncharacterized membrane protein YvbJ
MKICETCHSSYSDDKKFCKNCGLPLNLKKSVKSTKNSESNTDTVVTWLLGNKKSLIWIIGLVILALGIPIAYHFISKPVYAPGVQDVELRQNIGDAPKQILGTFSDGRFKATFIDSQQIKVILPTNENSDNYTFGTYIIEGKVIHANFSSIKLDFLWVDKGPSITTELDNVSYTLLFQ